MCFRVSFTNLNKRVVDNAFHVKRLIKESLVPPKPFYPEQSQLVTHNIIMARTPPQLSA